MISIKILTTELQAINAQIEAKEKSFTNPKEFLNRIEMCFTKALPFIDKWALDRVDANKQTFSQELLKLKKYCKILKLENKSELIKNIFNEHLENTLHYVPSTAEFFPIDQLESLSTLNKNWKDAIDREWVNLMNQGTQVKDLGFSEESLKLFLKKYGKDITNLNLEEFLIEDIVLFDNCPKLNRLNLSKASLKLDIENILQHENLRNLEFLDLSHLGVQENDMSSIAHLKNLKVLTAINCGITSIAPEILPEKLEELDLSLNTIGNSLSGSIAHLKNLKTLEAIDCGITSIAPGILPEKLEELNLSNNLIGDSLLGSISHLKNLKTLEAIDCNITSILPGILPEKLEELDLSLNTIGNSLSSSIAHLKNLKTLKIAACGMTSIVLGILHEMLEEIQIEYNPIGDSLPNSIAHLQNLKTFKAIRCNITSILPGILPEKLEKLDLSKNSLGDSLSGSIAHLKNLKVFRN